MSEPSYIIVDDDAMGLVPCPLGDELVNFDELRRPTLIMSLESIATLLRECDPQHHKTVREMSAVKVP